MKQKQLTNIINESIRDLRKLIIHLKFIIVKVLLN